MSPSKIRLILIQEYVYAYIFCINLLFLLAIVINDTYFKQIKERLGLIDVSTSEKI